MLNRIASYCLIALCLLMIAAEPAPRMIKIVIVTNAGKTLNGELVDADENHIRYKPSPKSEEIATIDWTDIKRVSNGITRQKVIDDIKKLLPERRCDSCSGEGKTACEKCSGTGVDPAKAVDCDTCHGTSAIGKCPKCKEGQMPCPATCIKPERFSGPKDAEGKRWTVFKGKSGSLRISDGHIGELIVTENGDPTMKGPCPTCQGKSHIECTLCHGTGNKDCPKCIKGKIGPACADCKEGKVDCTTCEGTGLKKQQ